MMPTEDKDLEPLIFTTMKALLVIGTLVSSFLGPWRVTIGLAFGGILALLNYRWLKSSVKLAFAAAFEGERPRISIVKYIFRYFIVAAAIASAYLLGLVDLVAVLFGLSLFGVAALIVGFFQTYIAVRESFR